MATRTRMKSDETSGHEAIRLSSIIPAKRQSEFTSGPQGAKITQAEAKQRLLDGISKIEASCGAKVGAKINEQLAGKVSRQIISICESGDVEAKIKEILGALSDIAKAAGRKTEWAFANLSGDEVASSGIFMANKNPANIVKHPSECAQIAQAASKGDEGNVGWAFSEIGGEPNASQFDRHPREYVQAAQVGKNDADKTFQLLALPEVASLLDLHPSEFIQIFQAPNGQWVMKDIATNSALRPLFSKNPFAFVQLAGETGSMLRNCVGALSIPQVGVAFDKSPGKVISAFAQMNEAAGSNSDWAYYTLGHDKNLASEFASWCQGSMDKAEFLTHLREAMK